jgi:hypothetical protein
MQVGRYSLPDKKQRIPKANGAYPALSPTGAVLIPRPTGIIAV